jgi:glycosyltransferase involved in cell wall biosynthesis
VHYLFVHAAHEWSGTARAFTAAASGLATRGHPVTIAVEPESTVERIVSQEAVVARQAPLFEVAQLSLNDSGISAAWHLRALARQRGADVVFVHTDREHAVAAAAFRLGSRAPVVRRVPAGQTANLRWSAHAAARAVPTCFLFTSEQDRQAAVLPRRHSAGIVAPLGVRTSSDSRAIANDAQDTAGEYIVCVHDASSRSRAATAIRTLATLAPRHPGLQLVITGEGGYDDDLRMQAAALGVLHLVSFLGDRADELQVMRGAQLGWVVADTDTAAYGMLDLMALGIPVLAGTETIAERYVLPNITGILLPPDDAYLAAAHVAGLLVSEPQRATMGHAARARVIREFPESAMIDGFEHAAAAATARRR